MGLNTAYRTVDDLPRTLPVFPLPGALLLPRGQLPLNIFEPRYLAMVDDAMRAHRLVGMVQPTEARAGDKPALYDLGCAGRITSLAETGDGRYHLVLTGVARYRIVEELTVMTAYRQCRVDFEPFAADLDEAAGEAAVDRDGLLKALRRFADAHRFNVDWDGVNEASNDTLVNALSMMSPFGPREKQALLEAPDLRSRADVLIAMAEFELARGGAEGPGTSLQ